MDSLSAWIFVSIVSYANIVRGDPSQLTATTSTPTGVLGGR